MRRGTGVAGDAAMRTTTLGTGWKRYPCDDQRDRGETLHEEILRLFWDRGGRNLYTPSSWRMAAVMVSAWWRMSGSLSASIMTRARGSVPL
jgi:hypothetical protein